MIPLPNRSPFTGGEIVVTRFYCPESDVTVDGQFSVANSFSQLSAEQLNFVELFVRSEGRISRMEGELGLSYPTIRSRLREIIQALGYEPGQEDEAREDHAMAAERRQHVLQQLNEGKIDFEQAMEQLQAGGHGLT